MAEYLPIYKPGQAVTLKASAAITGGQLVEVSGSGTVQPAGAASTKVVGVAGFDAATNDPVTIYTSGPVHHVKASGAVTAGATVAAAAGGAVASGTTAVVGLALTTAADGADVRFLQK